jgi:nitroreductase
MDAIQSRRNVRTFQDTPIAEEDLNQILEAGRRSPSSNNWQPWDFIVVTDREQLIELTKVWRGAAPVAHSAATIAIIAPKPAEGAQGREIGKVWYDVGQATAYIQLAAAELGIGSGHSAVGDQDLARHLLGFPGDRFCSHLIPLGYPADRPLAPIRTPDRRPFDEVVHRTRW